MLNITKGKKQGATRAVIYGTEGIGKTTLAASVPGSILIDTEDGSNQIDTARVLALDWRASEHAIKELVADAQGFEAVVIDSADWLERQLIEHLTKREGGKGIEKWDGGYGKGYTMLATEFSKFLVHCDGLIAKGVHVLFVAHSNVKRTSPPDQTDGFDRYELKLTKQVSPLLKEWADLILFCNYRLQIVEGNDGKIKAQGGKERIMYATRTAAWDAKNRFGLADELPMEFKQIAHLFAGAAPRSSKVQAASAVKAAVIADPAPEYKPSIVDPIDEPSTSEENARDTLFDYFSDHAEKVNAYFKGVKWITEGQTYIDLSAEQIERINAKLEKVAKAAGIPYMKEAA